MAVPAARECQAAAAGRRQRPLGVKAGDLKKYLKNRWLDRFSLQAAGRTIPSYCPTQIQTISLASDLLALYPP